MSRIQPTGPKGLFAHLAFWMVRRKLGRVPSSLKVTAHHPSVLQGVIFMERAQQKAGEIPVRLRTLASLRVATLIGCPF